MTAIVVREVQSFLMRTNLNSAALHAAVAFLNQTYLRRGETELAASLVRIYFGLFKRCVAEGGAALESRLLSALLTGVNRALPYHGSAASARAALAAETDVLFKITHTSPLARRRGVSLIHQLVRHGAESSTKDDDNLGNRFYTALYAQLHSPGLRALTKPTLFLNLVHRAMKADHHKRGVVAPLASAADRRPRERGLRCGRALSRFRARACAAAARGHCQCGLRRQHASPSIRGERAAAGLVRCLQAGTALRHFRRGRG